MRGRHSIFFALTLVALAVGVASCGGSGDDPYVSGAAISVRRTSLESTDGNVFVSVTCTGKWSITVEYPALTDAWATADPATGEGDKSDVRLRYSMNDTGAEREATLVLKPANGAQASVTVRQSAAATPDSPDPVPDPTGRYGDDVARAGWLEIPSTKANDGCDFFTLDYEGKRYQNYSRSGTRNYSFYWNYAEYVSMWVAYPLNGALHGKGGYLYDWANALSGDLTSIIPTSMLPNITERSYGGKSWSGQNWARGHQLPRADRQVSQLAVRSTCYPVNITPQDQGFNGGIWGKLENQVRAWADASDTTYVVTGCIVEGSRAKTAANSGFEINVPAYYYKAVLFKSLRDAKGNVITSAAAATGGYLAVGFLLPHDTDISGGNFRDYMMSVSELEKKTGIDFFINLPAAAGAAVATKIESEVSSFWK